jgi:hypothetical protein
MRVMAISDQVYKGQKLVKRQDGNKVFLKHSYFLVMAHWKSPWARCALWRCTNNMKEHATRNVVEVRIEEC